MTFAETVAELRGKFPKAEMSPATLSGACAHRAVALDFKKGKGGVYAGTDADGTEVLVYFNDTANLICCTEIEPDQGADDV